MNIPAPHTLVARVSGVQESDERGMIKLAEESKRRGFPEQAAIAYRKAAERFKTEGKHLKRIAVLNQLAKVSPNDPRPYLELVEANETIDRKRDADLARLAAAEIMRRIGREEDAVQLERQVAPAPVLKRATVDIVDTADDDLDSVAEMPGESVPLAHDPLDDEFSEDMLEPVMPVDMSGGLEAPTKDPDLLTMSKIDSVDPLDLSLDSEDQLDAMDEEELFDSVPDAPALNEALVSPVGGGTPKPLAIDSTLTASNEYGALSLDETVQPEPATAEQSFGKLPMIPDVATASAELNAVTENDGIGVETVLGGDLDAETIDPEADIGAQTIAMSAVNTADYDLGDVGNQTISYSAIDSADLPAAHEPDEDVGAQTIAYSAIDSADLPAAHEPDEDVGAQTIAYSAIDSADLDVGAQTIAMGAVDPAEQDPSYTMLGALDGSDEANVEIPPIAHTRELPKNVRFNIGDAATQMDPRGLPDAVVGTEHEARARAESRVRREDDDDDIAKALQSKIGS